MVLLHICKHIMYIIDELKRIQVKSYWVSMVKRSRWRLERWWEGRRLMSCHPVSALVLHRNSEMTLLRWVIINPISCISLKCSAVRADACKMRQSHETENFQMHKHRWQIWVEWFQTEYKLTHREEKKKQSVDWKAVASFQTDNIQIYSPSQQQVMGKLFFDHFLSQS